MQITESVTLLDAAGSSHAFLVEGTQNYLVDTGLPGQGKKVLAELETLGIAPTSIKAILLTHHDVDHIGNASMLQDATGAKVFAPVEDIPYILGEKKRPGIKRLIGALLRPAKPVIEGSYTDELLFGEIRPVHAPGHTPGHTMFLFENVLFCGDLLRYRGKLEQSAAIMNWDREQNRESLKLLDRLDFDWVCPAHSGPIKNDETFQSELAALAAAKN